MCGFVRRVANMFEFPISSLMVDIVWASGDELLDESLNVSFGSVDSFDGLVLFGRLGWLKEDSVASGVDYFHAGIVEGIVTGSTVPMLCGFRFSLYALDSVSGLTIDSLHMYGLCVECSSLAEFRLLALA